MDNRGYPTRFMKALAISIIAALCSGMAVPASAAIPAMPRAATATGSTSPVIGNKADKLEGWGLKPAKALGSPPGAIWPLRHKLRISFDCLQRGGRNY